MLLNIYVSDLKRLENGKVLMTSGDSAYNDCISFEIEETEYKLTMSGDDAWYADIDEEFFIKLCKELLKPINMLKLTQKEINAVVSKIQREASIKRDDEIKAVEVRPEIVAAVAQDLEWYEKLSPIAKDELGSLKRTSLLEAYVDNHIKTFPFPQRLSDDRIEDEIVLACRNVGTVEELMEKLNWITCWETKKVLPRGTSIHWCHPSRFEKIN